MDLEGCEDIGGEVMGMGVEIEIERELQRERRMKIMSI